MSQGFAREARIGVDLHVGETLYYTANDTFAKADYPGLYGVKVSLVGAGGGGGGCAATSSGEASSISGGGGGGYAEGIVVAADLGTSETITVGSGGSGGTGSGGSGGAGSDGGSSSFGSHVVATAGGGAPQSNAQTNLIFSPDGGAGGVGTAGDLLIDGSSGFGALTSVTSVSGGAPPRGKGGTGGVSQLGYGGLGENSGSGTTGTGNDGKDFGGGGSGTGNSSSQSAQTGGDGADGIVIVEVLYERKIAVDEDIHTQYLNDTRHDTAHQGATLSLGSNQSISNSTVTQVTFDTTEYDDASLVSGATFVIPTDWERVDVNAIVTFGSDATGRRVMRIEQDDVAVARNDAGAVSGGVTTMVATALGVEVSAGDVFDVVVFQDSGDPLNVAADATSTVTRFSIRRAK